MKGIRQNGVFSVNIPGQDMAREADYCGLISGERDDKAETCGFDIFYGKLEKTPMISQCPVNLECKVVQTIDFGSHVLVLGSIEETHITESCLTDGKPDVSKISPILYSSGVTREYYAYGDLIGNAFSIGNELKKDK
jgi:flavin reductase (DIM6/NTAB) family NADH-FMN oxidoreductase RutF